MKYLLFILLIGCSVPEPITPIFIPEPSQTNSLFHKEEIPRKANYTPVALKDDWDLEMEICFYSLEEKCSFNIMCIVQNCAPRM